MKSISKEAILDKVSEVLKKLLDQPGLSVTTETTADQVEGWDSLTHMSIISEVERVFNIEFRFNEIMKMEKVGDMVDIIAEKTAGNAV
ncbi:acyl carrier protein [Parasegetibacter sp. NRK P23]|uniref:acyl carrier protein n=1 Tax=Parasegetibacter sp. NRK P23 TaxID=2942999 RepID=UPI002043F6F3|nr:acyl carrier protein [Parasegetibacter sp. NRK P23]MCM5528439.1 acyl carrier protein [Parasegetibacter sp. NRK P23]